MIYFRKNDEVIEKYQVDFDKEEIEKLKRKIINNCSFIQHEEYESVIHQDLLMKLLEISHILLLEKKKNILKKQEIFIDIVMMNINHHI